MRAGDFSCQRIPWDTTASGISPVRPQFRQPQGITVETGIFFIVALLAVASIAVAAAYGRRNRRKR